MSGSPGRSQWTTKNSVIIFFQKFRRVFCRELRVLVTLETKLIFIPLQQKKIKSIRVRGRGDQFGERSMNFPDLQKKLRIVDPLINSAVEIIFEIQK